MQGPYDDNDTGERGGRTTVALGELLSQDRRSRRHGSSAASVQSNDSGRFSETKLGQMLAKEGVQAPLDFEVPITASAPTSSKRNLVDKVMRRSGNSSNNNKSRARQASTSRVHHYKQRSSLKGPQLNEQEQVLFDHSSKSHNSNPGIILIDDNNKFHDEPSSAGFDSDLLYLAEFGDNHNYNVEDVIAPSTHSRWMAEHAAQRQSSCSSSEEDEPLPKDIAVSESAAAEDWYLGDSPYPYRDEPTASSSPAKRLSNMLSDSIRGSRTTTSPQWPRDHVADPYRENLHTFDMEAAMEGDGGDALMRSTASSSASRNKTRRRRRCCLVAALLVAMVVGVLLVVKHKSDDPQIQTASGGLASGVGGKTVHVPQDPLDTRFFHVWSDYDIDYPYTGYALHPVREGSKYAIQIVAPDAGETTVHVKYGLEAKLRTGDVGCGDMPLTTLQPGASTTIQISGDVDTQIVACVFDAVVATTHHFMVPEWNGGEKVN